MAPHTWPVVSCTTSPGWRRYQRASIALPLAGGLLLLLAAAVAHDSASTPLLVIGGAWACLGAAALWYSRRVADALRLENGQVTFVFPAGELRVPAGDVLSFGRGRLDSSRMRPLLVRTSTHGTIKVSARLVGLFDFLYGLRQINPDVVIRDI
jgi:hypothetical protein